MTSRSARKRELNQYASTRRAIGALLASVVFNVDTRKGPPMVASRAEIRAKSEIRAKRYRPFRRPVPPLVPRQQPPVHVTTVHGYTVTTSASGETLATIEGGSTVEFRGPFGLPLVQLHAFACRYLDRRGARYLPGNDLVITLDGRGRKRETVEV